MKLFRLFFLIAIAVMTAYPVSAKSPKEKKSKTTAETVVRRSLDPNEEITLRADLMPQFGKGRGLNEFRTWVMNMIKVPKTTRESMRTTWESVNVAVLFVVSKDGLICNVEMQLAGNRPLDDEDLKAEIERVMYRSPKWIPAVKDGRNVNVRYMMPLQFNPR